MSLRERTRYRKIIFQNRSKPFKISDKLTIKVLMISRQLNSKSRFIQDGNQTNEMITVIPLNQIRFNFGAKNSHTSGSTRPIIFKPHKF